MATTIKDVARLAQVSVATVSRVLNDSATVSAPKRKRILQAIKKLNYKPNIIAQSLVSRKLNNIAIVFGHPPDEILYAPYIPRMLVGFGHSFAESGYEALLVFASDEQTEISKCMSLIEAGTIQGIVLLSARVYDRTINKLAEIGFPFVVVGHPHPHSVPDYGAINSVDTDSRTDMMEAVDYLLQMGHRRIGLLHSPMGYMVNQERHDGYVLALQNAGIAVDEELIVEAGYRIDEAIAASNKLLALKKRPSAVCATDDLKAVTCVKQARLLGLDIPRDLSVMGHNNYSESRLCTPSLSTVNVPIEDLAISAGDLLIEIINNPEATSRRVLLPSELILRDSVREITRA